MRRLLIRRYRVSEPDVDDLIEDAILSYLSARDRGHEVHDGLFFVIACRRALDYARHRRISVTSRVPREVGWTDVGKLEADWLKRALYRFLKDKPGAEGKRLIVVVREILDGASWSEACRFAGIPRGSESRYRSVLRSCFGTLLGVRPAVRPLSPPPCRPWPGR